MMIDARSVRRALLAASLVMSSTSLAAQTVVTPSDPHGWTPLSWYWTGSGYTNSGSGSTAAITTAYPRNGLGSVEISIADNLNTEADYYMYFANPSSLSSLTFASYDWYRSSSSTTQGLVAPAFSLFSDTWGSLIYEPYYNHPPANAPVDQWVTESNMVGSGVWWLSAISGNGVTSCTSATAYQSLAAFNTQCFGGNAMIDGIDVFMGFAGAGSFHAAFDNVQYAFAGDRVGTAFNFEPDRPDMSTVPEPGTSALLAAGLIGLFAVARRRRQKNSIEALA